MSGEQTNTQGDNRKRSQISEDLIIDGNLKSQGIVEFGGVINGNVTADTLVVTRTGRLNGGVQAAHVEIKGQLTGTIDAENVSIKPSAIVNADMSYDRLLVETGAVVSGHLSRGPARKKSP